MYKRQGKRAAGVGSGPSGLAAAYYLRRQGHGVTVFERQPKAGGVLRYGVPHYRLPKNIVDDVVCALEGMGVVSRLNTSVGRDVQVEKLELEFDGVFFGTGARCV